jgi:hypothetical protein
MLWRFSGNSKAYRGSKLIFDDSKFMRAVVVIMSVKRGIGEMGPRLNRQGAKVAWIRVFNKKIAIEALAVLRKRSANGDFYRTMPGKGAPSPTGDEQRACPARGEVGDVTAARTSCREDASARRSRWHRRWPARGFPEVARCSQCGKGHSARVTHTLTNFYERRRDATPCLFLATAAWMHGDRHVREHVRADRNRCRWSQRSWANIDVS